jgi:hypothetical protein
MTRESGPCQVRRRLSSLEACAIRFAGEQRSRVALSDLVRTQIIGQPQLSERRLGLIDLML